MPLIEHILQDLPADQRQLCFQFDQLEDGYTAEATLTLPSGKVCARTDTPLADYKAAVDQVVDKLAKHSSLQGAANSQERGGRMQ